MTSVRTVVCQSYRTRDVPPWIDLCLGSVRSWARARGHTYVFEDDALFERVPDSYRARAADRPMVLSDLGRLRWAEALLEAGYQRVVWLDADVFVFAPEALALDFEGDYAFGREVWLQPDARGRPRAHRKVHNALAVFDAGNPMLSFYAHACERIVGRFEGPLPPTVVGPRLLATLHGLLDFPTLPVVGTLAPRVLFDVLAGGGAWLDAQRAARDGRVAAINLGASLVGTEHDGARLDADDMRAVCDRLRAEGDALLNG